MAMLKSARRSERQSDKRPANREVENENMRPPEHDGEPPRPATEPVGAKESTRSSKLKHDPGSGELLK
jgi:hypothetical protein